MHPAVQTYRNFVDEKKTLIEKASREKPMITPQKAKRVKKKNRVRSIGEKTYLKRNMQLICPKPEGGSAAPACRILSPGPRRRRSP